MAEERGIPPCVLAIDDEVGMTTIISQILDSAGFRVETATSGPEGLDKAVSVQPDAIIVDIMMPSMDGYKVCRQLRSDPRTARAAILVLTARGQQIDEVMALQVGADAYMSKPFQGKALAQEIQRLLAGTQSKTSPLGYQILALRLKEGAGTTTLSTNLGLCLAKQVGRLAVVVDLALRGGQVKNQMGLPGTGSWVSFQALDTDTLAAQLLRHRSGLFVLPAPSSVMEQPDPTMVSKLLGMLRDWYDYVVLDTPRDLGPLAPILLGSPLILLLLTPDPAMLQLAELTLAMFAKFGYSTPRVWPVLNMMSAQDLGFEEQVEQALGLPVAAVLPWSQGVCEQALRQRMPVVQSDPDSALATAIQALAHRVVQQVDAGTREGSQT